jgi:GH15 family glucan-1,4-alpha-glucosidase
VPEALEVLARQFLDETVGYWWDWVRDLNVPFDWQEAVIRAVITLKLCSYDDTGVMVAALTTSIPESPGSGRTWDYRYCWLRDAYFTVGALNRLSASRTMEAFPRFILDVVQREGDAELAPLYPIAPIESRLLRNGFVMLYVQEDDLGKLDSAFLVCMFWYTDALAGVGRRDESVALFENVLAHRNHLGLLSEDIGPTTGVLWGNFPQTYSQVGLIFAAMRLSRSWEEGMWRAS